MDMLTSYLKVEGDVGLRYVDEHSGGDVHSSNLEAAHHNNIFSIRHLYITVARYEQFSWPNPAEDLATGTTLANTEHR